MTPRPRSQAACDTCRLRKTRCVKKDGQDSCVLCLFHDLECTFSRGPLRKRRRTSTTYQLGDSSGDAIHRYEDAIVGLSEPTPGSAQASPSNEDEPTRISTPPAAAYPSILRDTLGLDPSNNAEYVGSSDYRDPILLDLRPPNTRNSSFVRHMDDRVLFVIHSDTATASEDRRIADVDSIEAAVHPIGHILVDLYFRLLASGEARPQPDASLLEQLAETALEEDMRRPKLSTLEAGLLLLQRSRGDLAKRPVSSIWRLHTQIVAVSYDLGLHIDCTSWSIPEWEAGLRRRLGWALYLQDRWAAFVYGRPPLVRDDWDLQPCSSSDFPEYAQAESLALGGVAAPIGWKVFSCHIELAKILSEITQTYYATSATRRDGSLDRMGVCAAVDLAQPFIARLSRWKTTLPTELAFKTSQPRSLCASASLHLAYHAVIIALYRALVRILTPHTPRPLHVAVRTAARTKLHAAIQLLSSMSPEHTAAFWGGVAAYQVAMIGAFAGLLWATAETSEEMAWCASRLDDLKWALRIRGAAAIFARQALQLIERETGGLSMVNQTEG